MHKPITLLNLSFLLALSAPPAFAQPGGAQDQMPPPKGAYTAPPPPAQQMPPGATSQQLDTDTKDKFISAYSDVQAIQAEYTEKLQEVNDQGQAQELQMEAQAEMIAAVESNGLSVADYNAVTQIVANDPELLQEIQEKADVRN